MATFNAVGKLIVALKDVLAKGNKPEGKTKRGEDEDHDKEGGRTGSSTGPDLLWGGPGGDPLPGGSGGRGNDGAHAGPGKTLALGGLGNDHFIHRIGQSHKGKGLDGGGVATDTLRLELTLSEWLRSDVQADIARFLSYLSTSGNKVLARLGLAKPFTFHSLKLTVVNIGTFEVFVDGVKLDPRDEPVTAVADKFSLAEGKSVSGSVLANDKVPDLVAAVTLVSGVSKGHLTFNADGTFTYSTGTDFEYLAAGEKAQETFVYKVRDADGDTATATVTLIITGTNDAAVISGANKGTVIEDGPATAKGKLTVTDVDTGEAVLQPLPAGTPGANGYGTFEVGADGWWTYTLDNANPAVQALAAGQKVTDSISVTSKDGTATETITITIVGTNDAAVITGNATGQVVEDGVLTASGTLTVFDKDAGEAALRPVTAGTPGANGYGTFKVLADGRWFYTLDNANPAVQALAAGQKVTDSIKVLSQDGSAHKTIVVTITGTNDAAVITGNATGQVVEDGVLTASGTLTVFDKDAGEAALRPVTAGTPGANGYGTFKVLADGRWFYTLDNANPAVQALAEGQKVADSITVTSKDGTATKTIVITIVGTADGATITGDTTGGVVEDVELTASGVLAVTDGGSGPGALHPIAAGTPGASGYGTFEVTAAGVWFYTLDNAHPGVQALPAGATLTDSIVVTSADGTATETIVITITGTNDVAAIAGTTTGDVVEDGVLTASGTLTVSDIDSGEAELVPIAAGTPGAGGYGTFAVTAAGVWIYTLDNDHPAVQALAEGQTLTDSIVVTSLDSTASETITVTITGTSDGVVITGDTTGRVMEDVTLAVSGTLTATDIDSGAAAELQPIAAGTPGANGYGTFAVLANGEWTYTLDNDHPAVQALPEGVTLTDSIVVTSADGSASETIVITINGTNDAPVVAAALSAAADEDDAAFTLDLLQGATDVDAGETETLTIADVAGLVPGLSLDGTTLTVDPSHAVFQSLVAGEVASFIVTYNIVDAQGASVAQTATITITGTNDVTVITGDTTGDVVEDGVLTASGLLTVSDVDDGEAELVPIAAGTLGANGFGTFAVTAAGVWTYTLDNDHPAVQALAEGAALTDSIVVTSADGSAIETIVITINGTNDVATIAGTTTGGVVEDGMLTASGTLTVSDVDDGEAELQLIAAGTPGANGYGTFEVLATGDWTYALDNGHPAVQALGEGQTLTDSISVTSKDGTATETITITITGTADGAVIAGDTTGDVIEDVALTASGTLTVSDVDDGEAELVPIAAGTPGANGYGTFEVTAAGVWTYTLDNDHPDVQALGEGQTLTDSIFVTSADGTATSAITITITGTNDGATIAGTVTGNVVENGASTATGTLTVSDIDSGEAELVPVAAGTPGASGYGTFEVTAAGVWTYTLDNDHPDVQALAEGQTLTDSIVVTSLDGTASETITITIVGANTPPITADVAVSGPEDGGAIGITLAGSDVDGTVDAFRIASLPEGGTLYTDAWEPVSVGDLIAATGNAATLYFTPAPDFNGEVSFQYAAVDDTGAEDATPATVSITVTPVNDAPTFAVGDGIVTTPVGPSNAYGYSAALQADGKIVVAGMGAGSGWDFALVRYNADGSLDTTFGSGGMVLTPVGPLDDIGQSVALQADGKIVVAGYAWDGSSADFALVRYNADGSLDTTFGSGGTVTTPLGPDNDIGQSVALQQDGKIVVAGYAWNGSSADFALVRYNADGSLDATFGSGGMVLTPVGPFDDIASSVALQADGKIVVAGYAWGGSNQDFALVRYNADGSLDSTFGSGGMVLTPVGPFDDIGSSVALQADGKIFVAGLAWNGSDYDFALVRYNADGSLDTTFGSGGTVLTPVGSFDDDGRSVALQADGKIVVAGRTWNGSNYDFALVRYNADGSLDTTFGSGGTVMTPVGPFNDVGHSVVLQPDGKIVVVGQASNGSYDDFALVRYNSDGSLDLTFNPVNSLGGTASFTQGGGAVVLDGDVSVFDVELAADGSYAGATLELVRVGGADGGDVFGHSGGLDPLAEGGDLVLDGVVIGTVTQNSGGTLVLTFNADATQARVDGAMRLITYANTSGTPPASVTIGWTFSDGNTGAQGAGGALTATGTTTVTITLTNQAPETGDVAVSGLEDGGALEINLSGSDVDGTVVWFRIVSLPDGGALVTDAWEPVSVGDLIPATGNAATLYFDAVRNFNGEVSFQYAAVDDAGAEDATPATVSITVTPVNDAPTGAVFVAGTPTEGVTLWANTSTIADADGLGPFSFQWLRDGVAIDGATDGTYTLTADDVGAAISVVVSYTDGDGTLETLTSTATAAVLAAFDPTPVPVGDDFQVNTYTDDAQSGSAVAALEGGGFVVTWSSQGQDGDGWGIYGQRYGADGLPLGDEFRVNTHTTSYQEFSSVAGLSGGGFVVIWSSLFQDGSNYGIYGQRYGTDGMPVGDEFRVNTYTTNHQWYSSVAALEGGGFVVTWSSLGQDGSDYGIYGQRYGADGTPLGDEFQVNTYTASTQSFPSVAALAGGGFIVTWSSLGQDGSSYGVYGQRYGADGTPLGDEFQVNTYTASSQQLSSVAGLAGGGFVVTWQSAGQDGSGYGVYGQRYGADGTALGDEFQVNTHTASAQWFSSVAALAGGGFVVTWSSQGQDGDGWGVYGQRFGADGTLLGEEFRLNQIVSGDQWNDSVHGSQWVAQLADGRLVATWHGTGEIYARLIDVPQPATLDIVTANYSGTNGATVILGNGDGTFEHTMEVTTGGDQHYAVALGDLNGDGILDMVTTNLIGANGANVILGNGDGTFGAATQVATGGTDHYAVALGDLNGDGFLDIVTTNQSGASVNLGNGDGTFGAATHVATGDDWHFAIALGDLNGDDILDIVTTNYFGSSFIVNLGNGDGTFGAATEVATGGAFNVAVVLGDLDGDGILDIVTTNRLGSNGAIVNLGHGDGTFGWPTEVTTGGDDHLAVALGDLNGDGILDIVTTNFNGPIGANVNLGNGDGTFGAAIEVWTGGSGHTAVALGDLNGDGILDIVTANYILGIVNINLGNGDGTFGAGIQLSAPGIHNMNSLALGNLNTSNPAEWLLS